MTVPVRKRWRSLLFVPANRNELIQKAALRGADALILDLEDAVPLPEKAVARENLTVSADALTRQGASVLVRINHHPQATPLDVAALPPSVSAVVLPKVESAADIAQVAEAIHRRERELGSASGVIGVVPQLETPKSLRHVYEIAASPRVVAVSLGTEDFALALGVEPRPEALTLPAQMVCLAAAAAGVMSLALPTSIANFRDLDAWKTGVRAGRALGASGGLCIHPAQIPILNEVFSPSAKELAWAEAVVEAWTRASDEGKGVIAIDGEMIDEPVFQRALATLRRSSRDGA